MAKPKRSAADFFPDDSATTYEALAAAAKKCEGCDLFQNATQTVFGVGPITAKVMLVGEQPGDKEDRQGLPFVGPAGNVLDEALAVAGIDREQVYVTNSVKHFKFEPRGKRRIHKKPGVREMAACRPWLEAEVNLISPTVVVCLGATAAQSVIGKDFRITKQRGEFLVSDFCELTIATYHPSAILRAPDEETRAQLNSDLMVDLKKVAERLA